MTTISEVRKKYLDFFVKRGHKMLSSASLLPENDPTTLFTSAGMQPMMPYLLGAKHPLGDRLVDSQKCFRTVDIDEVGDNRHTTFFEMLGNWSLNSYFKKEQIEYIFEFLIKKLKLDPKRIYLSAFSGKKDLDIPQDDEAAKIWQEQFKKLGVGANIGEKIFFYDEGKNWWSRAGKTSNMPAGEPGGPDSEMFWDFDPENKLKIHDNSEFKNTPCHINCDCGRYMEIGNSVFMEYLKTEKGFEKLKQKNIDFGGGLERLTAAANDERDIFKLNIFDKARLKLEELSGKKYSQENTGNIINNKNLKAFRVILDHLRAAVFLIADGAIPSNKDAGYFTRRLIRRAVRFAHEPDIKKIFTAEIAELFIQEYLDFYPYLVGKKSIILKELSAEEEKFLKTLNSGLKEFSKGTDPFILFTTYGFPIELTRELALEQGKEIDEEKFNQQFCEHQNLSRSASCGKFKGGLADASVETTKLHTAAHLLLAGLRKVLGDQVMQKGANITAERLRFDFNHSEKMTEDQKKQAEDFVNEIIDKKLPVVCEVMSVEQAEKQGAMGAFKDRYGDKVKVYTIGDQEVLASREICGGPHVTNTGELGRFKIIKEESSSAGVRRIKAILE